MAADQARTPTPQEPVCEICRNTFSVNTIASRFRRVISTPTVLTAANSMTWRADRRIGASVARTVSGSVGAADRIYCMPRRRLTTIMVATAVPCPVCPSPQLTSSPIVEWLIIKGCPCGGYRVRAELVASRRLMALPRRTAPAYKRIFMRSTATERSRGWIRRRGSGRSSCDRRVSQACQRLSLTEPRPAIAPGSGHTFKD
jgi:hypothetical protein